MDADADDLAVAPMIMADGRQIAGNVSRSGTGGTPPVCVLLDNISDQSNEHSGQVATDRARARSIGPLRHLRPDTQSLNTP